MHPMLNVAVKAARRAGTVINRASLNLERLQVDRITGFFEAASQLLYGLLISNLSATIALPKHDG